MDRMKRRGNQIQTSDEGIRLPKMVIDGVKLQMTMDNPNLVEIEFKQVYQQK